MNPFIPLITASVQIIVQAQMVDIWLEALENEIISAVVMFDMSAAFDVVDHELLLGKLRLYGLDDSATSWFESYLTNRTQQDRSLLMALCLTLYN